MSADDDFDFYPCLVDGAPSSIYVNLRYEDDLPPGADTRYTLAIAMRERGLHGIGTVEETTALDPVEAAVIARAAALGIAFVGRLRTRGIWEIVLYGPAGSLDALRTAAAHEVIARTVSDPSWTYYRELLLPDAERRQWMDDRRMVQILAEQGDRLVTPRRVDHRLAFTTTAARDAFLATAIAAGFEVGDTDELHAHVHRVDPIELDHIHDVVMVLVDAAIDGHYDRWEAGIQT